MSKRKRYGFWKRCIKTLGGISRSSIANTMVAEPKPKPKRKLKRKAKSKRKAKPKIKADHSYLLGVYLRTGKPAFYINKNRGVELHASHDEIVKAFKEWLRDVPKAQPVEIAEGESSFFRSILTLTSGPSR